MALTPQERGRLAAVAAMLAAIGVGTAFVGQHAPENAADRVNAVMNDAGFVHASHGGTFTDLDSVELAPGTTGRSIVNLNLGATYSDVVPAPGFSVESISQDGTLVTVVVKNNTGTPKRFSGILHFNPAPSDAGVDGP